MVSEKECQLRMVEMYLREESLRAERDYQLKGRILWPFSVMKEDNFCET